MNNTPREVRLNIVTNRWQANKGKFKTKAQSFQNDQFLSNVVSVAYILFFSFANIPFDLHSVVNKKVIYHFALVKD